MFWKRHGKQAGSDLAFTVLINAFMLLILIITLYPLLYVLSASISDPLAVMNGELRLQPIGINFEGYKRVLENGDLWVGYKNSILYMILGTVINLILTILAAYPLSRKDLKGRNVIMGFIIFTMYFSGGMTPTYILVRNLKLTNTMWALILPMAISTFNLIVMKSYFVNTIPAELQEAAFIDGCTNTKLLLKVVLPLSKPILAVIALYYGVEHWNDFYQALIYLTDRKLFPLQLFLREILIQAQTDSMMEAGAGMTQKLMESESIKYAVIIFSSAPMLIIYPFIQKYFVKGVMIGSLKE